MGKWLIITCVIGLTAVALIVFFTREQQDRVSQVLKSGEGEPRIVVDDFIAYRYEGDKVAAFLTAKLGHFFEPNSVELYAAVQGTRYRKDSVDTMRCEAVNIIFDVKNMTELFTAQDLKVISAEIEDRVRLGLGDHILRTEYARYTSFDNMLKSYEPVQIDGPNRMLIGQKGFEYDLTHETLYLPGNIRGFVKKYEMP